MWDFYGTYILNAVGSLLAFGAAIIGFRPEKKLNDSGWPTKQGYMLGVLLALMCISQIWVQQIKSEKVRVAEEEAGKLRAAVIEAYTGWIRVGHWSLKQEVWMKKVDARMANLAPADIQRGGILIIGSPDVYYLNVRPEPPEVCDPEDKWLNNPKHQKNVLQHNSMVEVQDVTQLECTDKDQVDIWALVTPIIE